MRPTIKGHHDLEVYRRSYELALRVHRMSLSFPDFERYELGRQLRQASKSVPANIAEGLGKRRTAAEVRRFLLMALGSCQEVTVWLEFCRDLGYLVQVEHDEVKESYEEVAKMLNKLIQVWR